MEVIEKELIFKCESPETFDIYPLGDIHGGAIHCNEHAIKDKVEEIRRNKNAYWIGMGDYLDCILKNDKRFDIAGLAPWVQKDNIVESQRQWVKELFKPIAQKGLGLLTGNHEETIHLNYQDDITRNICKDLSLPYAGYSCFLLLHFTRNNNSTKRLYTIHAWHGAGAAQTEGARTMRLMRLVNDIEADIYLMGHLHAIAEYTPDRLVCRNGRVKSETLVATMTGSWLKTYAQPHENEQINASYAEQKGYKPSRIGCPIIHICPGKNTFTVES